MSNTVCPPPIRLPRRLPKQNTNEAIVVSLRCGAWTESACPGDGAALRVQLRYRRVRSVPGIVATCQDGRAENLRVALSRPGSIAAPAYAMPGCRHVGGLEPRRHPATIAAGNPLRTDAPPQVEHARCRCSVRRSSFRVMAARRCR